MGRDVGHPTVDGADQLSHRTTARAEASLIATVPSGFAVTSSTVQSGVPSARLATGELRQPGPICDEMSCPRACSVLVKSGALVRSSPQMLAVLWFATELMTALR